MSLQLRDDLSYCEVDGKLVFLDVGKDRYFRLSDSLERCFLGHQRGDCSTTDTARLVDAGLLIDSEVPASARHALVSARRSAIERAQFARRATVFERMDTIRTVVLSQRALKTRRLAQVLSSLEADRQRRKYPTSTEPDDRTEEKYISAAAAFLKARPYAPIATRCLVDSISLIRFLAKRGLPAHLVFAVTATPFSAHCWVQVGDLLLNETLGTSQAHTPIRVV